MHIEWGNATLLLYMMAANTNMQSIQGTLAEQTNFVCLFVCVP